MSTTAREFFSSKGAIALFCELSPNGSRFMELNDELDISHTTLIQRLGEAEDLDLIKTETVEGEQGRSHMYAPTDKGGRLMVQLRRDGVLESYQLYKEARRQFTDKAEEIREWLEENPQELYYDEKNRRALQNLRYLYTPDGTGPSEE
jgi:DNA-binding HxlR family transcriptional regulator